MSNVIHMFSCDASSSGEQHFLPLLIRGRKDGGTTCQTLWLSLERLKCNKIIQILVGKKRILGATYTFPFPRPAVQLSQSDDTYT